MYAFVVPYITLFHYPPVVIFIYLFTSYFCCNSARFYFFIIFKLFIIENFFSSNLHVCLFLWLYRSIENLFHVGLFCLVRRGPSAPSCMCKWPPIHLSLSLVAMLYLRPAHLLWAQWLFVICMLQVILLKTASAILYLHNLTVL